MTKKLKWRLGKLPSVDEVLKLMDRKLITKDEAQKILFSSEEEEKKDSEGLKSEITFLRELVQELSKGRSEIIDTIRYIEKPYYVYPWWKTYEVWCGGSTLTTSITGNNTAYATYTAGTNNLVVGGTNSTVSNDQGDFSSIKTF